MSTRWAPREAVMHDLDLIYTLTGALAVALLFGWLTRRLGLSTIVGYLIAGIAVGPYTPGFVADAQVASRLAEIGVILLMFSVGMHFDLADLLRVRQVAVPGAIAQSAGRAWPAGRWRARSDGATSQARCSACRWPWRAPWS
jgi:CPA2 family monovalent cation:H+ antiporter-2